MLTVYHGSTSVVDFPLAGVCRANLDFGVGFYVTDIRSQAERWALRVADLRNTSGAFLNVYRLDKEAIMNDVEYRRLSFTSYDAAWLDFVAACRRGYDLWKAYDVIEGGVADDRVVRTVDLYLRGDYTREEALARLVHQEPNNQICIVSQEVINTHLTFVEAICLSADVQNTSFERLDADPALQAKYIGIVERLAQMLHLSSERALDIFYGSDTYRLLSNRQGELYLMSDAYLADEVILELQRKQGG